MKKSSSDKSCDQKQ